MSLDHYALMFGTVYSMEKKRFERMKPHHGRIENWYKNHTLGAIGGPDERYVIVGHFLDHSRFKGGVGHTSIVIHHDEKTGEIETLNSRYTLVGKENDQPMG